MRWVRRFLQSVLFAVVGVMGVGQAAFAQGKVESTYVATLAGIPIGKGRWNIDISGDKYSVSGNGQTAGLLRVFASGDGNSSVFGTMANGAPVSSNFTASVKTSKWTEDFRIVIEGGTVKQASISPEQQPNPERVPLTDAHRHGVVDPMTGSLIRVPGKANLMRPEICQRTINVFDGRIRYDLQLAFKRMDQVSTDKGYFGSAVVCSVYFLPIAGHNPNRTAIKYLVGARDMEFTLVPIAGTRIMVPFRVFIPTPLGPGILTAIDFSTVASPRAAASSPKTQ